MLEQELKEFGLGDYEARIYALLLEKSPAGASYLASKCKLARSSVYTTLDSLIAKGLVGTTYKNEIKQFIAQGYSALEQLMKKQQQELHRKAKILDTLKNHMAFFGRGDLNIPKIMFFEGQEGLKNIYISMMREAQADSILHIIRDEFVWEGDWQFIFDTDWHDRVKRLKIEKNISTKLLINSSEEEKKKEGYYKTRKALAYRFLPKNFKVREFTVYIIGDIVSILSIENNNLVGIKITNNHIARNFMQMFSVMWQASK